MATPSLGDVLRYIRHLGEEQDPGEQGDGHLLRQFVATKDEAAFAALLQRHGPLVFGVCRQVLRNAHDAEDAFQATFLVLARKAASIHKHASLAAWLHRVALNLARTATRSAAGRRVHERQAVLMSQASPADDVAGRDWQAVIHEEVDRLPEKYRVAVVLCYLEGKTHEEAARQLGWPLGTVKGRLARGRKLLHSRLSRRGLVLSAAGLASALAESAASAAVPPTLLGLTLRAAVSFSAGAGGAAGAASAKALALAKGALPTISVSKLLHLMILLFGAGLLSYSLVTGTPPEGQRADPPVPPAKQVEAKAQDTDLHGDALPAGALARLGTVRFRHGKGFWALAFSPDGKTVASAGAGGRLVLHDAATGKILRSVSGRQAASRYPTPVAFAPDGKTLAAGDGDRLDSVLVWEVATGKQVGQLNAPKGAVYHLAFSHDGRTLAGGGNHLVYVWDVAAGKEIARIAPPPDTFFERLALTPDGKTLATAGCERGGDRLDWPVLCLWDTASGRKLHQWQPVAREEGTHALAFSPDGKRLASATHYGDVPDTHSNNRVRVWGVPGGERQLDLQGRFGSLGFSPCGKILAAAGRGSVSLLDADTGKETRRIRTGWISGGAVAFRPDGKVLALEALWTVTLWDVASGDKLGPALDGHDQVVDNVMFLADGKTLVSTSETCVYTWDARTGRKIGRFEGPRNDVDHRAVSPDGRIRVVSGWSQATEMGIALWDTATGKKLCELQGPPKSWPRELSFSADAKTLAAASDDAIRLWEAATGRIIGHLALKHGAASVAFSPDGRMLAVGDLDLRDQPGVPMVRLLDPLTGGALRKPLALPATPRDPPASLGLFRVGRVAFSADGKRLAAATTCGGPSGIDHAIQVWDVETGQILGRLSGVPVYGGDQSCRFALSPDGKSVLTPGEPPLLWEVATGKVRGQLRGHSTWAGAVAFSPDGRLVASGSRDTTALVWDALNLDGWPPASAKVTGKDLEALWAELLSDDAAKAYDAMRRLVAAAEQTVPFLRQHFWAANPDAPGLARLIADLDADEFTKREKATRALERLGRQAKEALEQALAAGPSREARRRLERLLQRLQLHPISAEDLRRCRAIESLEYLATAPARTMLERLVREGPDTSPLVADAQAALERLRRRPAAP